MDGAMFDDKCTVLPIWVRNRLFNVTERFPHRSKDHPDSKAKIILTHSNRKKTTHDAYVTTLPRPNLGPVMRLYFGNDVKSWLVKEFNKTHLRNEERKKHGLNGPKIEALIPFWEFIDIEWDAEEEAFHFRAWYTQGDFTENKPGQELESLVETNSPPTMSECIDLAIHNLGLKQSGNAGRFKWYRAEDGNIVHIKYSKYYDNHMNYWYGVTPESLRIAREKKITHFGFITANRGCSLVTINTMLSYVATAKTSEHEDGNTRHFHFFINGENPPVLYQYESQRTFPSEFIEFDEGDRGGASNTTSSPPSPPQNQFPDWLTQALNDAEN